MLTDNFDLQLFAEEGAEAGETANASETNTDSDANNDAAANLFSDKSDSDSEETSDKTNNDEADKTKDQKDDAKEDKTETGEADFSKITVPEGFEQPSQQFIDFAKTQGLNPEQVQGLVDFYTTQLVPAQEAADAMQIKSWEKDTLNRFDQDTISSASQALKDLAGYQDGQKDNEIMNFVNETGIGSHPAFVALMAKMGGAMKESTLLQSNIAQTKSGASLLFGQPNSI